MALHIMEHQILNLLSTIQARLHNNNTLSDRHANLKKQTYSQNNLCSTYSFVCFATALQCPALIVHHIVTKCNKEYFNGSPMQVFQILKINWSWLLMYLMLYCHIHNVTKFQWNNTFFWATKYDRLQDPFLQIWLHMLLLHNNCGGDSNHNIW